MDGRTTTKSSTNACSISCTTPFGSSPSKTGTTPPDSHERENRLRKMKEYRRGRPEKHTDDKNAGTAEGDRLTPTAASLNTTFAARISSGTWQCQS